jgi:phenylalanyl-tRNA synthetase alpha chain
MTIDKRIEEIKNRILDKLTIDDLEAMEELRVEIMGKKGSLTTLLKSMGQLSPEERPIFGQRINELRDFAERHFEERRKEFQSKLVALKTAKEQVDVTIPGKKPRIGHLHPITATHRELIELFIGMGYEVAEGPEIEKDYYNFEALNIPAHHPAKDEQDTFYINGEFLLRSQTSSVQVHVMERGILPIKIVAPGKCYRSDDVDATHSPMFNQMEGLVVDKDVNIGHLRGTLEAMVNKIAGRKLKTRFRPHHFQFTEPSAEMDVECFVCDGKGCRVCKDSGFIELLGCGMVHPRVLEMSGIDPTVYSGFAFGVGTERLAMLKYGITDLRLLFDNDVRFLRQF